MGHFKTRVFGGGLLVFGLFCLLAEDCRGQVSTIELSLQQDDFLGFVSLLSIHFTRFGFHQTLSVNMDHFFWRRPHWDSVQVTPVPIRELNPEIEEVRAIVH